MIIITGLGNPGKQFEKTRHNVGFMVLDRFAEKNNFPEFKLNKNFNAEISKGNFSAHAVVLSKPQTFMNDSGKTAKKISENYKSQITNFIIVHDDIDLQIGKIKIVLGRGSAGHKGVESIIKSIGNKGLIRIRIGIAPNQTHRLFHGSVKAEKIVLKNFSGQEKTIINGAVEKSAEALSFLIANGPERTMSRFN